MSVVRARLVEGASAEVLGDRIREDPRLGLALVPETVFFAEQ